MRAQRVPQRMHTDRGQRKLPLAIRSLEVFQRQVFFTQSEMDNGEARLRNKMMFCHFV